MHEIDPRPGACATPRTIRRRMFLREVGTLALAAALPAGVRAQSGSSPRTLRLVVPYPPGGLPDTMARVIAQRLVDAGAAQAVVENRPGAGGILACELVAKAPPDGGTLLVADLGQTAINGALYASLPYDTLRDFAPVSLLGTSPFFLAVHASTGWRTLADLVAAAKARPGALSYGSSGNGSPHHLAMETLKARVGMDITHVPYKGSGQSTPALLGGQVPALFTVLSTVAGPVKAGTIRLLAVASATRTPQAPDVPTFAELGVKDMLFLPSVGVLAPSATPAATIARLGADIARAVKHPESAERFNALGIEPLGNTPEEYAVQLRRDIAYYAQAVKLSGAKAD